MARASPVVLGVLLVAILVSLGLFALTLTRRTERGAYPLLLFLGSIVLSTGGYALQLLASSELATFVFHGLRFSGVALRPPAVFLFALMFAGYANLVTRRNVALVFAVPVLTVVVIWTSPLHGLFAVVATAGGEPTVQYGGYFFVHAIYSYLLIFAALALFARQWVGQTGSLFRVNQASGFLVAVLLPTVGSLITVGAALSGQSIIDVASLSFAVSGVVITATIFRL